VAPVCALLADTRMLARDALVYVEMAATEAYPKLPPEWSLHREKVAGSVMYRLFDCDRTDQPA
jgi:16S rRNA (guanine966-N2)-methyltransferase